MFGHIPELIVVLIVGLLIFGPKRVIEMGSAAGKMLRELREAVKDMNWSTLVAGEDGKNPLAELHDLPRTFTAPPPATPPPLEATPATPATPAAPSPASTIVESVPVPPTESSNSPQERTAAPEQT